MAAKSSWWSCRIRRRTPCGSEPTECGKPFPSLASARATSISASPPRWAWQCLDLATPARPGWRARTPRSTKPSRRGATGLFSRKTLAAPRPRCIRRPRHRRRRHTRHPALRCESPARLASSARTSLFDGLELLGDLRAFAEKKFFAFGHPQALTAFAGQVEPVLVDQHLRVLEPTFPSLGRDVVEQA